MVKFANKWEDPDLKAVSKSLVDMFNAIGDPEIISLGGGAPAPEGFPVDDYRSIMDDLMRRDARGVEMLQYGTALGVVDLREQVAEKLIPQYGVNVGVENIMISSGGQEPIGMTCDAFCDPGDVVLVESPTFVQSVLSFMARGAKCVGCEMDDQGIIPEDVEAKIKQYKPKMLYVIPNFHNPTGRTIPFERRKALYELAQKYDIVLLEDDPYRDIRFYGEGIPAIKSLDTDGRVVWANSFSKIFSPGTRMGYIVADKPVIDKLETVKYGGSTHANVVSQIVAAEYFRRGLFPAHLKELQDLYRSHADAMMKAIDSYFPADAKHTVPEGGLFTWAELPGGIDTNELLAESVATIKVAFVAGSPFFAEGGGKGSNCMRISYSTQKPEVIDEAICRLGGLINKKLGR